jgi:hypothetical protein
MKRSVIMEKRGYVTTTVVLIATGIKNKDCIHITKCIAKEIPEKIE